MGDQPQGGQILIKVLLDTKGQALETIQGQLTQLEKDLKPIQLKLDLDPKVFEGLQKLAELTSKSSADLIKVMQKHENEMAKLRQKNANDLSAIQSEMEKMKLQHQQKLEQIEEQSLQKLIQMEESFNQKQQQNQQKSNDKLIKDQQKYNEEMSKLHGQAYKMMEEDFAKRDALQKQKQQQQQNGSELLKQADPNLYNKIQDRVREVNNSNSTPANYTMFTDAQTNLQRAVISYNDAIGQLKKEFWSLQSITDENGKSMKVWVMDAQQFTDNVSQVEAKLESQIQKLTTLRNQLTSVRSPVANQATRDTMVAEIEREIQALEKLLGVDTTVSNDIIKNSNGVMANIRERIAVEQRLQQQILQQNKTGFVEIGQMPTGMSYHPSNEDQIKSEAIQQFAQFSGLKLDTSNIKKFIPEVNSAGQYLHTLTIEVKNADGTLTKFKTTVNEATGQMRAFAGETGNQINRELSMFKQLEIAISRIPVWMAGMTLFYQSLHFFTDGVAYVNELNKALTQISIVTGQSQAGVQNLVEQYHNLANAMSVTTQDVAKGAVEFYRQGLNQTEVMNMLQKSIQYAKISNIDFADSAKILTATVNSLGVDAQRAIDVFSYLGDATATGADEIGKAVQKVGGTAGAMGIDFMPLNMVTC